MGDNFWLGFCAQDLPRALRAAQGVRACRPHADCRDQGFRRKGEVLGCQGLRGTGLRTAAPSREPSRCLSAAQTPQLVPPSDHKAPVQRDEGTVHRLARPGPERHLLRRAPAPGVCGPPPPGPFSGSEDHMGAGRHSSELLRRVRRVVVYAWGQTEALGRGQKEISAWRRG